MPSPAPAGCEEKGNQICVIACIFIFRGTIMSKIRQSNKEPKKQPMLTPKEKKTAKQAKQHAPDLRLISQGVRGAARKAMFVSTVT
jgi:hypothetical protein